MNATDQQRVRAPTSGSVPAEGCVSYYGRERSSIIELIPQGRHRVFDVGCGMGAVGKKLLELGRAAEVEGVELFEPAAREAAKTYRRVHVGDIETMPLDYHEEFDYVICGDVLEHLKDPYIMLHRISGWLKPQGCLACSLPNIRYWRVLADLVFRGQWEYQDSGILDRTHLRFFTRRSCLKMLENAGFGVEVHKMLIYGWKKNLCRRLTLSFFDEFLATQVLLLARKKAQTR